jgi:hypothetical protein
VVIGLKSCQISFKVIVEDHSNELLMLFPEPRVSMVCYTAHQPIDPIEAAITPVNTEEATPIGNIVVLFTDPRHALLAEQAPPITGEFGSQVPFLAYAFLQDARFAYICMSGPQNKPPYRRTAPPSLRMNQD